MSDPSRDQYLAAVADAECRMREATASTEYEQLPTGDVVGGIVNKLVESVETDKARMCSHVIASPAVVYALAALPGALACRPCIEHIGTLLAMQQIVSGGGPRCDNCNEVLAGKMARTGIVQHGPVLIGITLCMFCATIDAGTATEREQV